LTTAYRDNLNRKEHVTVVNFYLVICAVLVIEKFLATVACCASRFCFASVNRKVVMNFRGFLGTVR